MKKNNKKRLIVALTAAATALTLMVGSISSFASPAKEGFIGETKAKEIALAHAGLKEKEVSLLRVGLGLDKGVYEYDVEFYKGTTEYDYEIDAKSGKILEVDKDIENFVVPNNKYSILSVEKAKEISLRHVGLKANEVKFLIAELGDDNGKLIYDVEFYMGNIEFDFEIDAKTGKIVKFDKEIEGFNIPNKNNNNNNNNSNNSNADQNNAFIGLEKAKEVALKYANLKAGDVVFAKAKLEKEGRTDIYDIEITAANYEYDFEIDAKTGRILEFDFEPGYHQNDNSNNVWYDDFDDDDRYDDDERYDNDDRYDYDFDDDDDDDDDRYDD